MTAYLHRAPGKKWTRMNITTTWRNDNPGTIWNRLAARLGRQPTNAEAEAEVKRILSDCRR